MVLAGSFRIFSSMGSRTFWHQRSTRLSLTLRALNRMSSLEYMMDSAFLRLWGVCLEASTWTCIPQDEFTTAPARRRVRTTSCSFPISLYSSLGEFISTLYSSSG